MIPVTLFVSGVVAVAACTSKMGEDSESATAAIRNDGKEPHATNPGKLSCEDHGFPGADTAVDLGGVNRTLDLGGGASVKVTGAHAGKSWHFHWEATGASISMILMRSGNKDSYLALDPAKTSGDVTRDDVEGESKPGLNRIAFCYTPGGGSSSGGSSSGGSSSGGSGDAGSDGSNGEPCPDGGDDHHDRDGGKPTW